MAGRAGRADRPHPGGGLRMDGRRCPMKITQVLSVPVRTGFFTDDQAAIRNGVHADGFTYAGAPVTPGFTAVRQAGEAVAVMFVLRDGVVAEGDCAAVQYSGVGGRDALACAGPAPGPGRFEGARLLVRGAILPPTPR